MKRKSKWTYDGDEGDDDDLNYDESEDFQEQIMSNRNEPAEDIQRMKKILESDIDNYIRSTGISNPEKCVDNMGFRTIQKGSAIIKTRVVAESGVLAVFAGAKIMDLPSDIDLILPLMRELLENNLSLCDECRFAISNNMVLVTGTKAIFKYDESLIPIFLQFMSESADRFDDYYQGKYGGTSKKRI